MTIEKALAQARRQLEPHSDAPDLDAERLLLHVLGKQEPAWLHAHGDEDLSPTQAAQFEKLIAERATGKPLAYILGEAEFYGRPFYVNEHVLIPRPETEHLIEATLNCVNILTQSEKQRFVIADIGTGSGIIAITLALELPTVFIIATDISKAALEVARKNAERHGVVDRIQFLQGNMLDPLADRKIDLIVSNPPYLPAVALAEAGRARDTKGLLFEPRTALDGGPDGQDFIRQIKNAGTPAILEVTGGKLEVAL